MSATYSSPLSHVHRDSTQVMMSSPPQDSLGGNQPATPILSGRNPASSGSDSVTSPLSSPSKTADHYHLHRFSITSTSSAIPALMSDTSSVGVRSPLLSGAVSKRDSVVPPGALLRDGNAGPETPKNAQRGQQQQRSPSFHETSRRATQQSPSTNTPNIKASAASLLADNANFNAFNGWRLPGVPSHADLSRTSRAATIKQHAGSGDNDNKQSSGGDKVGCFSGRVEALMVNVVTPAGVICEGEIVSSVDGTGESYLVRCPFPDEVLKPMSEKAAQRFRRGAPRFIPPPREESSNLNEEDEEEQDAADESGQRLPGTRVKRYPPDYEFGNDKVAPELRCYLESVIRSVTPDGLTDVEIAHNTEIEQRTTRRFFTAEVKRRDLLPFGFMSPSNVFSRVGRHTNLGIVVGVDPTFFTYLVEQRIRMGTATAHDTARGVRDVYTTKVVSATLAELQLPPALTRGAPVPSFRVGSVVECRRFGAHDLDEGVVVAVARDVTYSVRFKYDDVVQEGILHSDMRLVSGARAERVGVRDRVLVGLMGAKRATVVQCFPGGRFRAVTDDGEQLLLGDSNLLSLRPPILQAVGCPRALIELFDQLDEGLDGKVRWLKFRRAISDPEFGAGGGAEHAATPLAMLMGGAGLGGGGGGAGSASSSKMAGTGRSLRWLKPVLSPLDSNGFGDTEARQVMFNGSRTAPGTPSSRRQSFHGSMIVPPSMRPVSQARARISARERILSIQHEHGDDDDDNNDAPKPAPRKRQSVVRFDSPDSLQQHDEQHDDDDEGDHEDKQRSSSNNGGGGGARSPSGSPAREDDDVLLERKDTAKGEWIPAQNMSGSALDIFGGAGAAARRRRSMLSSPRGSIIGALHGSAGGLLSPRGSIISLAGGSVSTPGGGLGAGAPPRQPNLISVVSTTRQRNTEAGMLEKEMERQECIHDEVGAALDKAFEEWQACKGMPPNALHSGHDLDLGFNDLAFLYQKIEALLE